MEMCFLVGKYFAGGRGEGEENKQKTQHKAKKHPNVGENNL